MFFKKGIEVVCFLLNLQKKDIKREKVQKTSMCYFFFVFRVLFL
jgi:hypothetical protein